MSYYYCGMLSNPGFGYDNPCTANQLDPITYGLTTGTFPACYVIL